ncbi:MAG: undecaprenyl-phosphate glucose phosphotransferase [Muribaculaceae bacterium]|nr:undecaprenyl-phosphate glucose phosphotransferase [Muribaculaceae bacterium]
MIQPGYVARGRYIPLLFAIADVAVVNALFVALCLICPGIAAGGSWHLPALLVNLALVPELWWGLRRSLWRALQLDVVTRQALSDTALHALFFISLLAIAAPGRISARELAIFYSMMFGGMLVLRLSSRAYLKHYRRRGRSYARVVIVGATTTGERFAAELSRDAGYGYRLLGFFDDHCPEGFKGKYLGRLDELEAFIARERVHQVFYCGSGSGSTDGQRAAEVLRVADDAGAEFFFVPRLSRYVQRDFDLMTVGTMTVMAVKRNPLKSPVNRAVKRLFDFAVSSVFLCLYPLIYLPVAIAIKMSSSGPVYFKQQRTGYHGRTFTCLKFRTMRSSGDADKRQATAGDPRVTRIGAWLRRTSIDELPQFINVWRGDMSIVGPRPHMLKHTDDYSKLIGRYMARHAVKPGITGWAQVNGLRGPTDELWKMERRVEADVWYIEHWTLLLDMKIMVRTVINAFAGEENAL